MHLIYLHGFRSSPSSKKAQQLLHFCAHLPHIQLHVPDLNCTPNQVIAHLSQLIERLPPGQVALVGSSLGGFYANHLVAKYACPALLINPAMQPWQLFQDLFSIVQMPLQITHDWTLDAAQLQQLQHIAALPQQHADKILVLLQQGDEVLDYRLAQRYYSAVQPSALILTELGGNHAMDDFEEKLAFVLDFLAATLPQGNATQ